jgi:hypothetical protein
MDDAAMMPGDPTETPQMDPQQAMQILQQFKIPQEAIPQILAACEALEGAQQGGEQGGMPPPQQQGAPQQSLMQALSGRYSAGK